MSSIGKKFVVGLALVCGLCLISSNACASKWGKVADDEWQMGKPADLPEAGAAVIFDRCSLFVSLGGVTVERHVRMKVFNKAGAAEIGDIDVSCDEGDKIKDLKAQTILPDGKTVKVDNKDIHTKTLAGDRIQSFAFPALDSGCIAEYRYTRLSDNLWFLRPWYFQWNIYVMESQFTLILAPGFTYTSSLSRSVNGSADPVEGVYPWLDDPTLHQMTSTWTQRNLRPIKKEPYMGLPEDYSATLRCQLVSYIKGADKFEYIKDWSDVGQELQEMVNRYAHGGDLGGLAARLTAGGTTQNDKLRRIYNYVSDSIKDQHDLVGRWYTNSNLGKLLDAKSGTGFEKNALVFALAREAGIPAQPLFISTRDHLRFDPLICHLLQFNHMIVFAQPDSTTMLMDATSRYCPYSMLPPNSLVDAGLLVDGKDSKVIKVGRTNPGTIRVDSTTMTIDSAGTTNCSTTCIMTGYFAPQYGEWSDEHKPGEFLKEHFLDLVDRQAAVDSQSCRLDSAGYFVVTATYSLPNAVRNLDNNLVVKPPIFLLNANPFESLRRSFPVDFNFPFTYHNIVRVSNARKITSSTLPANVSLAIRGVGYDRQSSIKDGMVVIDSKLTVSEPIFAPGQYKQLRELFEQIGQAQAEELVLTSE